MKMRGEPDPLYVAARSVLLDALEALGSQRDAIVLVALRRSTCTPAPSSSRWRSTRPTQTCASTRGCSPSLLRSSQPSSPLRAQQQQDTRCRQSRWASVWDVRPVLVTQSVYFLVRRWRRGIRASRSQSRANRQLDVLYANNYYL